MSDTCRVMRNITEYVSHFFTRIQNTESAPLCATSFSCDDISCVLPSGGYYNMSILVCSSTPAVQLAISGQLSYNRTIYQSEALTFTRNISLNFTIKIADHFTLGLGVSFSKNVTHVYPPWLSIHFGLQVDFQNMSANDGPIVMIPYVEILLDRSMCESGDYTHKPLVTSCDIMPLLSQGMLSTDSLNISASSCSVTDSCDTSRCNISSLENATILVNLHSCFQPPNVEIFILNSDGTTAIHIKKTSTSERRVGTIDGRRVELSVTVVQRSSHSSIGLQVSQSII